MKLLAILQKYLIQTSQTGSLNNNPAKKAIELKLIEGAPFNILEKLPAEMLFKLLTYLSWKDLKVLQRVSKACNTASTDSHLWAPLLKEADKEMCSLYAKNNANTKVRFFAPKINSKQEQWLIFNSLYEMRAQDFNILVDLQKYIDGYCSKSKLDGREHNFVIALRNIQDKAIKGMASEKRQICINKLANIESMKDYKKNGLTDKGIQTLQSLLLSSESNTLEGKIAYVKFLVKLELESASNEDIKIMNEHMTAITGILKGMDEDKYPIKKGEIDELKNKVEQKSTEYKQANGAEDEAREYGRAMAYLTY